MKYILDGDPKEVGHVLRENRIRVSRGVITFTPCEPDAADTKDVPTVDTKDVPATDTKEVKAVDSKNVETADVKKSSKSKKTVKTK